MLAACLTCLSLPLYTEAVLEFGLLFLSKAGLLRYSRSAAVLLSLTQTDATQRRCTALCRAKFSENKNYSAVHVYTYCAGCSKI